MGRFRENQQIFISFSLQNRKNMGKIPNFPEMFPCFPQCMYKTYMKGANKALELLSTINVMSEINGMIAIMWRFFTKSITTVLITLKCMCVDGK